MVRIASVDANGPAGLSFMIKEGDELCVINKSRVSGLSAREIEELLQGPPHSFCTLRIRRDGVNRDVTLERAAPKLKARARDPTCGEEAQRESQGAPGGHYIVQFCAN